MSSCLGMPIVSVTGNSEQTGNFVARIMRLRMECFVGLFMMNILCLLYTSIVVWERDAQYPTYNAFRSFLYNSVKNAGLNHLKHKNVEEKYLASLNLEDEGDDIDLKMMEEELYRLLFKTIDELPDKCRNIFLLHLEGKGNEEIALLLNLSILTVKTQKKRAMSYIRERLGRVYFVMMSLGII